MGFCFFASARQTKARPMKVNGSFIMCMQQFQHCSFESCGAHASEWPQWKKALLVDPTPRRDDLRRMDGRAVHFACGM